MVDLSNLVPRDEVLRGEATFVVNLSDLNDMNKEQAKRFLELNVFTGGMKTMLKHTFQRLNGESEGRPILKLSETMGGGKTQSLITAGILAKYPDLCEDIDLGFEIRTPEDCTVISFSGRNIDKMAWVEIGEKLGANLPYDRVPSEEEWRKIFKDKTVLILLDEISFYLIGLSSQGKIDEGRQIAQRASLAFTNMLGAIRDFKEAKNVVAIISDLKKDWEQGEEELTKILDTQPGLQKTVDTVNKEMSKGAMTISPVDSAKDELYEILKKRLFVNITTTDKQINKIAEEYTKNLEPLSGELAHSIPQIHSLIVSSYPFHFSTKDLIASFNQNQGFQKTRDVIRLFAEIVRSLWNNNNDNLSSLYTLSLSDADFNDPGVSSRLTEIKPELQDARTTDVAASGNAHAETLSDQADGLTKDAAKWIFIASLSDIQVRGLDQRELLEYMAKPGIDVSSLGKALDLLYDRCWYIERNSAGFYYFHRKKNLNARINDYTNTCSTTQRDIVVADKIEEMFLPREKHCYQRLEVFPKLDEITIRKDVITLLAVRQDSQFDTFFKNSLYKNRMMFLTSQDSTGLIIVNQHAKRVWAIRQVAKDLENESDATKGNLQEAEEKERDYETHLFLSIQSVFNTLLFPLADDDGDVLERVNLEDSYLEPGTGKNIKYGNNVSTKGEFVIEATLRNASKFVEFNLDANDLVQEFKPLQQRYEAFLFPQSNRIRWENLQEQAAIRSEIIWTRPDVPERMKNVLLQNHIWRYNGEDIEKGPFQEQTSVSVDTQRDDGTGEIIITDYNIENADILEVREDNDNWYQIKPEETFKSKAMRIEFRAVDSSNNVSTGYIYKVDNRIDLHFDKKPVPGKDSEYINIKAIPDDVEVVYTLDGSDPANFGQVFPEKGLEAESGTHVRILARKGDEEEKRNIEIKKTGINPDVETKVQLQKFKLNTRMAVRNFVRSLPDDATIQNAAIIAINEGVEALSVRWPVNVNATKDGLTAAMDFLEERVPGCEEQLKGTRVIFTTGAVFAEWRNTTGANIEDTDIIQ